MNIKIERAIQQFFPASSFPMVIFESVANAFDANAREINIRIHIDKLSAPKTLSIEIEDDGVGFDDTRFGKFKDLLETDDAEHRGLGRLVFLRYFNKVDVESYYGKHQRNFCFHKGFNGEETHVDIATERHGTKLKFSGYLLTKINDQKYITAADVASQITDEFLSKLFLLKQEGKDFKITISLDTIEGKDNPLKSGSVEINKDTLPRLTEEKLQDINLFSNNRVLYQIEHITGNDKAKQLFAYNIDGRSFQIDVFRNLKLPKDYNVIFILASDWLKGKTDSSRTSLDLKAEEKKALEELMIGCVSRHLSEGIPTIKSHNETIKARLNTKFPHLSGYFSEAGIGLVEENRSLDDAQQKFFDDQKKILGADTLTPEQYDLALSQSSRVLMEYVLYRNFVIQKLEAFDPASNEDCFHNLIVPMKKEFRTDSFSESMFLNNAWLLDDKYMNYSCVLSDKNLNDLLREIKADDEKADDLRPDIAIVFSKDVNDSASAGVDVVLVELKKKDNELLKDNAVIEQLRQRARRLIKYYGTKIQRIWYYGIVGFTTEFRNSIRGEWTRMYSNGDLYYKEMREWAPDDTDESTPGVNVGYFLNSYDALRKDASARNETFLNVLRASIQNSIAHSRSN